MATPMTNLEASCRAIAQGFAAAPSASNPTSPPTHGVVDIMALVTLIGNLAMGFLDKCIAAKQAANKTLPVEAKRSIAASMMRPGLMQKISLNQECRRQLEATGNPRRRDYVQLADMCVAHAKAKGAEHCMKVIDEVASPDHLWI